MREYAKQTITDNYGTEALNKIEKYLLEHNYNVVLVYVKDDTFEIVCGCLTNHSMSIDELIELSEIDMDEFANANGWDGWDYDCLEMIDVE